MCEFTVQKMLMSAALRLHCFTLCIIYGGRKDGSTEEKSIQSKKR